MATGKPPFCCFRDTRFDPVALLWSVHGGRPRILRILLSSPGLSAGELVKSSYPDAISAACAEIDMVAGQIAAFLAGHDIRFPLDLVRLDLCSPFQQQVLRAEHAIPRGRVSTYQRIARHIGNARGARAVGTALAHNPFPVIVPCHRAIRTDGTLGGFQGGIVMKRALLEMEGVRFADADRVVAGRLFY